MCLASWSRQISSAQSSSAGTARHYIVVILPFGGIGGQTALLAIRGGVKDRVRPPAVLGRESIRNVPFAGLWDGELRPRTAHSGILVRGHGDNTFYYKRVDSRKGRIVEGLVQDRLSHAAMTKSACSRQGEQGGSSGRCNEHKGEVDSCVDDPTVIKHMRPPAITRTLLGDDLKLQEHDQLIVRSVSYRSQSWRAKFENGVCQNSKLANRPTYPCAVSKEKRCVRGTEFEAGPWE
ncbi:hypothetical protein EDB87DRAFT_1825799 [Lactarius vividus]|nr:hypothetical protein EDB87DRAFT_1825799 [Lactarius vividus]